MTGAEVLDVARDAIWTIVLVSSPLMLVGLVVGVAVSLVQAEFGFPSDPPGTIDAAGAEKLNSLLVAREVLRLVQGKVNDTDGAVVVGQHVVATDVDLAETPSLGAGSTTNAWRSIASRRRSASTGSCSTSTTTRRSACRRGSTSSRQSSLGRRSA